MHRKIIGILICTLLIGPILLSVSAFEQKDETLDQSTPLGSDGYICGINNDFLAQSFKPKLSILSKVELGLWKQENITGTFTISIRQKLNGEDLVSKTVSIDEVPWQNYGNWVTIDFEDISVIPDKRYYLFFTSDDTRVVFWIMTTYNPYLRGQPWSLGATSNLPFWIPLCLIVTKIPDLCFRTYGYDSGK
jgi:hypothetical protein